MVSWTRGDAQEAAAWTRACPGREPSCLRSLNQALGDSQRGRRSHQNSVAVVTPGQPESHSASPADDRLRRCWPPVEIPATPRPAGGQPRQKRSRPRVNVRDQDWIERPIKAHLLGGGSRNRESAAPLQQIGVPAAENRPQRVWLECVSDEVAANRESAGPALTPTSISLDQAPAANTACGVSNLVLEASTIKVSARGRMGCHADSFPDFHSLRQAGGA